MLGLSRTLTQKLVPLASTTQVYGVRHKGTVIIPTIAPPPPNNENTRGPYPRTPEERLRAARKYNLIPEDYETYDEDEGWGDYPKLPAIGAYNRDKYEDFDDILECRSYGEPMHMNQDLYRWERIDPLEHKKMPPLTPYWLRIVIAVGVMGVVPAIRWFLDRYQITINQDHKIRECNLGRPFYEFPPSPNDNPNIHHAHH